MDLLTAVTLSDSERVANGAQMLDEKLPGWYERIDQDKLDVTYGGTCICGQLGGFTLMTERLSGLDFSAEWSTWVVEHGFTGDENVDAEWRLAIQARLDADKRAVTRRQERAAIR
jgi:hypothetical protein